MEPNSPMTMKEFRKKLGLNQVAAGKVFGASQPTIANIELGYTKLGWQRHGRMIEALRVFETGGLEAVTALAPFVNKRVLRTVPAGDADEMVRWRERMGLSRQGAMRQLGFGSWRTIAAIESGRRRITERVREFMRKDEKKGVIVEP